jgi:PIN domain nuclease of toxin-antitoxin system
MRLLLDTHTLLWWLNNDPSLPAPTRDLVAKHGNTVLVSAVSAWEIAVKFNLGKLPSTRDLLADFNGYMNRERFEILPISADHAVRAGLLPGPLRDPFDRMLIAQGQAENVPVISNDRAFDAYGIHRIW